MTIASFLLILVSVALWLLVTSPVCDANGNQAPAVSFDLADSFDHGNVLNNESNWAEVF